MKRYLALIILFVLGACALNTTPVSPVIVVYAQTLPITINFGANPDTTGATMGYKTIADAGTPVDVGLPAVNPACGVFGNPTAPTSPCVPFSVTYTTGGTHTFAVLGYDVGGNSPSSVVLTFSVVPPGAPQNPRITGS